MNVVEIISGTLRSLVCDALNRLITVQAAPLEQRTDIGALDASAIAFSDALDLGPPQTRQHTRVLFRKDGFPSAGESINTQWSDDADVWRFHLPAAVASAPNANATGGASSAAMNVQGIPFARYCRMQYVNGATPQTALKLAVTAIAGI